MPRLKNPIIVGIEQKPNHAKSYYLCGMMPTWDETQNAYQLTELRYQIKQVISVTVDENQQIYQISFDVHDTFRFDQPIIAGFEAIDPVTGIVVTADLGITIGQYEAMCQRSDEIEGLVLTRNEDDHVTGIFIEASQVQLTIPSHRQLLDDLMQQNPAAHFFQMSKEALLKDTTPDKWAMLAQRRREISAGRSGKPVSLLSEFPRVSNEKVQLMHDQLNGRRLLPKQKEDQQAKGVKLTPKETTSFDSDLSYYHASALVAFDKKTALAGLEKASELSSNSDRFDSVMKHIEMVGGERALIRLKSLTLMEQALEQLKREMPNFKLVIDAIALNFNIAFYGDKNLYFPPILLVGPPGVGKTYFAKRLAKVLHLPLAIISMENQLANGSIGGTQAMYANSRPGMVFNQIVMGDIANPLILVDEVEKGGVDFIHGGGSPINQLLSLLESHSAEVFQDQSIEGMHFNARWINWILTANDLRSIPAPVRSRAMVFQIQAPSEKEMQGICQNIYQRLLDERSVANEYRLALSEEATSALAKLVCETGESLRELPRLLQLGYANAKKMERTAITTHDMGLDARLESVRKQMMSGLM